MGRYAGVLGVVALTAIALTGCNTLSSNGYAAPAPTAASATNAANANAVADYNRAQMLRYANQCHQAIPLYLRAITKNPMYVNAYRALGACYQAGDVGNLSAAILQYDKALQIDPTNFGIYIDRAGAEISNGNTGAAQADDLTAMRLAPRQVPSYLTIAQSFASYQDLADDITAVSKAIEVAPGNASLYEQRASVYLLMNDVNRAFADYMRALQAAPFSAARAPIYADIADVYSSQQNYDSAFKASETAIKLQPDNASLYVRSGNIHQSAGDYAGAFALYSQALRRARLRPDLETAHEGKGDTYIKLNQPTEALAEYRRAATLASTPGTQSTLAGKLAGLADTFSGIQRNGPAFQAIALAISLQPTNPSLYVRSGNVHLTAAAFGAALSLYDQALRLATAPSDLEAAHEGKGDTYIKMGQVSKAVAEYQRATRLTSDADILTRLNDKIKAAAPGPSR